MDIPDMLSAKVDGLEKKIDKLQSTVDKVRKIFLWTLAISVALFVLPLIGLMFAVPRFLETYSSMLQ